MARKKKIQEVIPEVIEVIEEQISENEPEIIEVSVEAVVTHEIPLSVADMLK